MIMAPSGASLRVLVTGADGFVGRHLQRALAAQGIEHRTAVRVAADSSDHRCFAVGDIGPLTDWSAAVDGIDVIVHLAGRAHVLRETASDPQAEFMRVNAKGTAGLVVAAVRAGVRRVVYVSSIGVHGDTTSDAPFTAASPLRPHNAYAESKLSGESAARSAAGTRVEVVVLRPPLVYGSGVRANFLRLMQWIDKERPLPLGAIRNSRSLVNVWNLCDLLINLSTHPNAPGRAWMVSDDHDLSTAQLIRYIANLMGRRAKLLPIPLGLLNGIARLAGKQVEVERLCESLVIDIKQTRDELGWHPPVSFDEGLSRTVRWYLSERRSNVA